MCPVPVACQRDVCAADDPDGKRPAVPHCVIADGDKEMLTKTLSMLSSDATLTYTLNGFTFHTWSSNPIHLKLGTTQEWVIRVDENSDSGHPFHIHVNPFQVMSSTDPKGNVTTFPDNTWRDTLFVDPGFSYVIRSTFAKDIGSLSVLHCHILDHEDQGMMWPINLSDQDPPVNSASSLAPELKPVASRSPAIELPDGGGKPRDLAGFRGRKVRRSCSSAGRCFHCAEQLRGLVRNARGTPRLDAEIVAVSSSQIDDPEQALKALGVTARRQVPPPRRRDKQGVPGFRLFHRRAPARVVSHRRGRNDPMELRR